MKNLLVLMLLTASVGICIGQGYCPTGEIRYNYSVSEGKKVNPDYLMKADAFLNGAMSNKFYMMTVQEFLNKSKNDTNWVIVDIRQPQDYFQGHIKGAMNIPFTDLIANMKNIPAGKKVAVYCATNKRSPYGVMALRIFDDRDAWVMLDGVSAWKAAGQQIELPSGPT